MVDNLLINHAEFCCTYRKGVGGRSGSECPDLVQGVCEFSEGAAYGGKDDAGEVPGLRDLGL